MLLYTTLFKFLIIPIDFHSDM